MSNGTTSKQTTLETSASKILAIQLLLTIAIAYVFFLYQGQLGAQAASYGGFIVMFNVWMTSRRMRTATKIAQIAPGQEVKVFYVAAVQRFVFTLGFFILGMGWLQLPPIPMLVTFAIVHLGYIFGEFPPLKKGD
jgi:ATP synthase protein I